ncbi:DUF6002 family protein [Solwaraspora sp. WMMB335]|uniref:DUF6002 family protein n=1 Tax=Solwaraspora sp. WMMB335 TaxID=3404118 RepID=UPI003B9497C9
MKIDNTLVTYYAQVQSALQALLGGEERTSADFTPGIGLPELTPAMREYLSVSSAAISLMPEYQGRKLSLLDLTCNPGTRTTKTFASLVMVARAIRFIQYTGQRVTLISPSSANKATALRDAVLSAIMLGLVTAEQLNIIVVVPAASGHKLRATELATQPDLRIRNPIAVYTGSKPDAVKALAQGMVDRHRISLEKESSTHLWYTLRLENYLVGDVVRALVEADLHPPTPSHDRLHVHAVSSAYGLLGHAYGRELLGSHAPGRPSRYFLVQHLGTADMVESLYAGTAEGQTPAYKLNNLTGLYEQRENLRFPTVTFDSREVLDTTFYTKAPVTSPRMNSLIHTQGGGGIVVSLAECLERYGQVRALLEPTGLHVPANPTAVLEWSLIMAMTGILNAIDRDLVPDWDILVHGSGIYSRGEFDALSLRELHPVQDADSLRDIVAKAATA